MFSGKKVIQVFDQKSQVGNFVWNSVRFKQLKGLVNIIQGALKFLNNIKLSVHFPAGGQINGSKFFLFFLRHRIPPYPPWIAYVPGKGVIWWAQGIALNTFEAPIIQKKPVWQINRELQKPGSVAVMFMDAFRTRHDIRILHHPELRREYLSARFPPAILISDPSQTYVHFRFFSQCRHLENSPVYRPFVFLFQIADQKECFFSPLYRILLNFADSKQTSLDMYSIEVTGNGSSEWSSSSKPKPIQDTASLPKGQRK